MTLPPFEDLERAELRIVEHRFWHPTFGRFCSSMYRLAGEDDVGLQPLLSPGG